MTIKECSELKQGDHVLVSLGKREYQTMKFIKLVHVVSYGKSTISEFLANGLGKGRNVIEAELEYVNDYDRLDTNYFNLKRLIHKV